MCSLIACSIRPPVEKYLVQAETMTFTLQEQWQDTTTLYVWRTAFGWDGMTQTNSTFFESLGPVSVVNGQFSLTVNPDELYTVTTLSTGNKASIPEPPPSQPFPTFYEDDFESYNISSEASYFADQAGMCAPC
jgi:galactosylceramidase